MTAPQSPPALPPHASPPPGRRRRRARRRAATSLVALAAVSLALGASYYLWASGAGGTGERVALVVPKGASASEIAALLGDAGVIRSSWLFRMVVRARGLGTDLRAGKYELRDGMSYDEAIAALRKGPAVVFTRVTIPEGKTVEQVAAIVGRATHIRAADFLAAVRGGRHGARFGGEAARGLEGFLFPKTYDILEDATADDAVALMVRQFERETASLDLAPLRALGVTPFEAVTIASMIEREARVARDRPLVSSVIYNRLRRGMRLQIDATVQYAIFKATGTYKTRLLFADLEIDSPYNTYRVDGLPPGPIAAPGLAALRAALAPATTSYLYYVLVDERTGAHAFASTAAEFERAKARARRSR